MQRVCKLKSSVQKSDVAKLRYQLKLAQLIWIKQYIKQTTGGGSQISRTPWYKHHHYAF